MKLKEIYFCMISDRALGSGLELSMEPSGQLSHAGSAA